MNRDRLRGLHLLASVIALACAPLAWSPCAFALDPTLDVSQYAHTSWKIRDGFTKGRITSMAQTPDGYLWLGTEFGLFRFDGVRNVPFQPPADQPLPSITILRLLATRDGALWIGTDKGLASWKGGKVTQYPELAGHFVFALLEDRDGAVWAGTFTIPTGKLCSIRDGRARCYGETGSFGRGVLDLYEDRKGNLWATGPNGLWRWKPGQPELFSLPAAARGTRSLTEDIDDALLIVTADGIKRFAGGKTEAYPLPGPARQFRAGAVFRDRDGGLWIGGVTGLLHVHQGRTDVFTSSDGLSGDGASAFFEDREGNIWVLTSNGLDRFRELAVPTLTAKQGLSNASVYSVLAAVDGSVLLSTAGGLDRWSNGQITPYTRGAAQARQIPAASYSFFQDGRGRIWAISNREFGYLENGKFIPISGVPGGVARSIVEGADGNLWIANQNLGLFRLRGSEVAQQVPWDRLGHRDFASALAVDPVKGGVWLGFFQGGVVYFKDGEARASYGVADGLGEGLVNDLRFDQDGALWAATAGGLSRLENGRIVTLKSKNGFPCDGVHWMAEDDDHSFWLYTTCGLIRIARSELDAWGAAVSQDKNAKRTLQAAVFDISDGVTGHAYPSGFGPQVARTADGKLWFPSLDGVSVVDPRRLPFNRLPPPVRIEQVTADHKTYATQDAGGQPRLPPLVRTLTIDYTALSLVAPEKVKFRYKLEPRDRDWEDAGNRRQAFYNDLPPGSYRFCVTACNNSGVWNEAGAFLDFSIAPAYYQTTWFLVSGVVAFLASLVALYRLRLRQVARRFNIRLEERVAERTRIARDFHDTLLQSFQGVLLKFHSVTYMLQDDSEARQKLEGVIEQAQQAVNEGRNAVRGLRSSTLVTNELAKAIGALGEDLRADQSVQNSPDFRVIVEGASRDLIPLVRDEVYRIAGEALRNAFQHSQARQVEVEIQYAKRRLKLQVRDNGKGIDPTVLAAGGREGHYGLAGMYERAKLAGGKLAVLSKLDSGTEIDLTIPASVAYAKSPAERRSLFSRK